MEVEGFAFPLGVAPVEPRALKPGYVVEFEAADGAAGEAPGEAAGEEGRPGAGGAGGAGGAAPAEDWTGEEWEEWPDRFMYDIVLSASRLRPFCRVLFEILPGRVYPILDVLGRDAYREIDPYLAYDPVGIEKFLDGVIRYADWLYEDGLAGFGAMSLDPFFYVFIDEHKVVTLRASLDLKERVEKILAVFDLKPVEKLDSVDALEHEHRPVLHAPPDRPDLLGADDIIDRLREDWKLELNIDRQRNVDDEGNDLGLTAWQCIVRCRGAGEDDPDRWAEVLLTAEHLDAAERLAGEAVAAEAPKPDGWAEVDVSRCDRLLPEEMAAALGTKVNLSKERERVHRLRWLDAESSKGQ